MFTAGAEKGAKKRGRGWTRNLMQNFGPVCWAGTNSVCSILDMPAWFHAARELLIPPASLPVLAIAASLIRIRWPRTGRILVIGAIAGLSALSLPITARLLIVPLEAGLPLIPPKGGTPGAIVVLGGDVSRDADGRVSPGSLTLERLRATAELARQEQLPILVSSGPQDDGETPVAALMARTLADDFAIPATWLEAGSKDTWENAQLSEAILRRQSIASIYLVTQAWHIRRGLMDFAKAPVIVTAAPTRLDPPPSLRMGRVSAAGFRLANQLLRLARVDRMRLLRTALLADGRCRGKVRSTHVSLNGVLLADYLQSPCPVS
jgi:uncharacterized SAM-binding protein YcdF (DUF218 family)